MGRVRAIVIATCLVLAACGGLGEAAGDLRERLEGIDVRGAIANLTDCDTLSDTFVGLVRGAADTIDGLAETTDGRVPKTEIRGVVDDLTVSQYFAIAEQLGCARVQMELQLVNRIVAIDADSPEGNEFLDLMVDQVQQQ